MKIKATNPSHIGIRQDSTDEVFIVDNNKDLETLYEKHFKCVFFANMPSIVDGEKSKYVILGIRKNGSMMKLGHVLEFQENELDFFIHIKEEYVADNKYISEAIYSFNEREKIRILKHRINKII
jgi:hypothetical protein